MESKYKKSENKKYRLISFFKAIKRHFLLFIAIFAVGINVGVMIYFLVPQQKYVSVCNIAYNGSKLDEFQQSRINDLIASNESVDKYVMSLAASNIKNGDSNFTFSEISTSISSNTFSVSADSKNVVFAIRFSFDNPDVGIPVLKVVSARAVKELNAIYTRDSFGVINDSFTNESTFKIFDPALLLTPIALSLIVGIIVVVLVDLKTDILDDVDDCSDFFTNTSFVKVKNEEVEKLDDIKLSECLFFADDLETIRIIFSKSLNKDSKLISLEDYILNIASNEKTLKTKHKNIIVLLGITKYSSFISSANKLKEYSLLDDVNVTCIAMKTGFIKNVRNRIREAKQ